jgi:hypothetical protein
MLKSLTPVLEQIRRGELLRYERRERFGSYPEEMIELSLRSLRDKTYAVPERASPVVG